MAKGWHMVVDGARLTLARRLPVRWDAQACTVLPDGNRAAIAHQIRQDIWRALRGVRGFSPIVEVTREAGHLHVRAGGRVDGGLAHVARRVTPSIAAVLERPDLRARWCAHA